VRSAVYQAASPHERRRVHRALADVTDPEVDPDRRAWHRAQAAPGPDEAVASELERSAGRAQGRGGFAAAAAFLERAAALTLEPARRAQLALAAAHAKLQAGAPDAALHLLTAADAGPLEELERARADLLRAQIAFEVNRGSDAPPLLLAAARRLEPLDPGLARRTYLEAVGAALFAGSLASDGGLQEAAEAALAAPAPPGAPRAPDLLLDGLAALLTEGYAAGTPLLNEALSAFRGEDVSAEEGLRHLWLACHTAMQLWDDESWEVLSTRFVQLARDVGAVAVLPLALTTRAGIHLFAGEFAAAASLVEELEAIGEATGTHLAPYAGLSVVVWQGRQAEAAELIEDTMKEVMRRGEGIGLGLVHWARAALANAVGRYEDALAAAEPVRDYPMTLLFTSWGLLELIEAAARSGHPERGAEALERLTETTRASGTDWALGIEARSRALLADGDAAEPLYREAIERLGRTRVRLELARSHLVYGEWLRRERRRLDAREHLSTAYDLYIGMGIVALAERAARELLATGQTARRRTVESWGQLTAQEVRISQLARDGLSNREIGARLFISPRTVEYHLHKVFGKLAIGSRSELVRALSTDA
jgi:DNA-binding CsgD family transcriptional regulator